MPKLKMTDRNIANLPSPDKDRVDYIDMASNGLVLRVSQTGRKSWSVVYRILGAGGISPTGRELRGKQGRVSLGPYPKLSLAEARIKAAEINDLADRGIDPNADRLEEAQARFDNTLAKVAERMLSMDKNQSSAKYESVLRLHINPILGKRPVADLTIMDIDNLIDGFVIDGKDGTAREVRKVLRKLLGFAKSRGLVDVNIMADYQRRDIAYQPRDRVLTSDELVAVWNAAKDMPYPHGPVIQLLMLTGLRRNEVAQMKWAELDHENQALHLGSARSKTRARIFAPMSDTAWTITKAQPQQEGPYVFSTTEGHKPSVMGSKALDQLRKKVGFDDFTFHDLRRTLRTRLAMLDVPRDIAERIINHSQGKDQYDQYGYQKERKAALDMFAAHLEGLVDGG